MGITNPRFETTAINTPVISEAPAAKYFASLYNLALTVPSFHVMPFQLPQRPNKLTSMDASLRVTTSTVHM